MQDFIDQTGRTIQLQKTPRRIISLVPSQTELLFDLGLDTEVIGITKFCVHPTEWFCNKIRIGGTKDIKVNIIQELQPDLIIANKEENVKEQIEELEKHFPVWVSDINNLNDAYEMMMQVGRMINKQEVTDKLIGEIKKRFAELQTDQSTIKTCCYLIWQNPYLTVGADTFIHSMIEKAGFTNCCADKKRYPTISIEEIQELNPHLIFLSSEPYPFKQKHIEELQKELPAAKIILVDGELFSWYGSRLLKSPAYFKKLHEEIR